MDFIISNWYILLGVLAVLVAGGFAIYKFAGLPTAEQITKVKKLLLYWVTLAEKELGSGTGEIKLRYVYQLFVTKFPFTARLVSFDAFSLWVDEALDEMEKLLKTNEKVNELVNGVSGVTEFSPVSDATYTWTESKFSETK